MRRLRVLVALALAAASLAGCTSDAPRDEGARPAPLNDERPERDLPKDEAGRGEQE